MAKPPSRESTAADILQGKFFASGDASIVFTGRTADVDSLIAAEHERLLVPTFPKGLALLAVGGYGRAELFPHSDIDLMVLSETGLPTKPERDALAVFLQSIWDAGLRLSHSVHSVKECCELHEQNIELNISLLDRRFLAGDTVLWEDLAAKMPKFLQAQRHTLARHLTKLSRQRYAKFHGTIYHLEPNIKEAPGGLRDLHMLHWFERMGAMADSSQLTELAGAGNFLHSIRCYLHYVTGRDNNLLNFEAQEEFAELEFHPFRQPADTMREYFRNARAIFRAAAREMEAVEGRNNSLLAGFREWRSRLSNSEFTISKERVLLKSPQRFATEPLMTVRLFEFVSKHKVALHPDAEKKVQEKTPELVAYIKNTPAQWPHFEALLSQPNASFGLRAMHETGLLGAIFPAWHGIECFVLRDFHHRYTVDEHTLITIENLESLATLKEQDGRQRFAALLTEIPGVAILKFALLFHDTGKGEEGPTHCEESAALASAAADQLGIPEHDREALLFLIRKHLVLSSAMTGRDLDDPATTAWLAHAVGTLERLKLLTLLTLCDIGAVNPTALSPWRMEQLWRVYLVTHQELTRELESERIEEAEAGSPERLAFLKGFPTRYLRTHTNSEVEYHLKLESQRKPEGMAIDIRQQGGVFELTVLAKDRLFLFASLAGALASFGMNIRKAEAFANEQGTILDTFSFEDPQHNIELNPQEIDRLRLTIERVVLGKADAKSLLKNRPRTSAPSKGSRIETRVSFDGDASDTATLVEVVTEDRTGLLYRLTTAFSEAGCNIEVVLVNTEAHKAMDVFYVTTRGGKLDRDLERRLRESLITACLTEA